MEISDNAIRLWLAFFRVPGNKLSFGGDHALMAITPEGRDALNELIRLNVVCEAEPDDQWPNREHYTTGAETLQQKAERRPHLNPFLDDRDFAVFRPIEGKDGGRVSVSMEART